MDISYALWGMLFGYLVMPTGKNASRNALTSYAVALVLSLICAFFLAVVQQVWVFLLGVIGQYSLFTAYYLIKRYLNKTRSGN